MVDPDKVDKATFHYMNRDEKTLARPWVIPGMKGLEFRLGGLEKDIKTGCVSTDPRNHELMCHLRQKKVDIVAEDIALQAVEGENSGDLLVVSWGGTYGACSTAVRKMQADGKKVSLMHMKYLNPMPRNTEELLKSFKKIIVPELNLGQLRTVINAKDGVQAKGYNKVQGLPFKISELVDVFNNELNNKE